MNIPGSILKTFRLGKRITQADLAKRLQVNQSTLSRAEISTIIPFDILMEMHKKFGDEWDAWVRKPYFLEDRHETHPGPFIEIPVVAEVMTETFEFGFEMFPREVLYLGSRVAGLKLGMDFLGAKSGEYLIISESRRIPSNCIGLVKNQELATLKKVGYGESLSTLGVAVGTFKKLI